MSDPVNIPSSSMKNTPKSSISHSPQDSTSTSSHLVYSSSRTHSLGSSGTPSSYACSSSTTTTTPTCGPPNAYATQTNAPSLQYTGMIGSNTTPTAAGGSGKLSGPYRTTEFHAIIDNHWHYFNTYYFLHHHSLYIYIPIYSMA
jgi:hypothetical protein